MALSISILQRTTSICFYPTWGAVVASFLLFFEAVGRTVLSGSRNNGDVRFIVGAFGDTGSAARAFLAIDIASHRI